MTANFSPATVRLPDPEPSCSRAARKHRRRERHAQCGPATFRHQSVRLRPENSSLPTAAAQALARAVPEPLRRLVAFIAPDYQRPCWPTSADGRGYCRRICRRSGPQYGASFASLKPSTNTRWPARTPGPRSESKSPRREDRESSGRAPRARGDPPASAHRARLGERALRRPRPTRT